jgi:hypothetical protein
VFCHFYESSACAKKKKNLNDTAYSAGRRGLWH